MFRLIKSAKYDIFVNDLMLKMYFIHQLSFVVSASALARGIDIIYKVISIFMIGSFLIIVLLDIYNVLRGKFTGIEIIIYAIIGIILLISLYNYRAVMVIANLVAISAFKDVDWKKTLTYFLYATVIGFIINILLGIFTLYAGNVIQGRMFGERVRYGLGFFYCTMASFYYTTIVMVIILLKKNIKFYEYIIIIAIDIILFMLTDTKAAFLYVILMLLAKFIYTRFDNKGLYHLLGISTLLSYPIFFFITYFLSLFYNPNQRFFVFVNSIVSGRFELTNDALKTFGYKLFGQTVPIIFDTSWHVDSSMISMLMLNGLLVLIISLVFMTFFCYIAYKTHNPSLLIVLFFIAFRSSFDLGFMALQFSPVVFLFMPTLREYLSLKK